MVRKTVLEKFTAVRDAINGPGHAYFSGRTKRLKHVEREEYKGTASVPSLDDCMKFEFLAHYEIIPLG
jgi:hypothetical protein